MSISWALEGCSRIPALIVNRAKVAERHAKAMYQNMRRNTLRYCPTLLMNRVRDPKRRPTHSGEVLREDVLPALGISQGELARRLGVSRLTVSELLREKRAVSPDMALRLARLHNTSAESWLNMQQAVDLWKLGRAHTGSYARIKPVKAAA